MTVISRLKIQDFHNNNSAVRVLIELPLSHYDRFFSLCDPDSREYALLKNGVIVQRSKGDRFERIVKIDCTVEDAKTLLNLARQCHPAVVPDIEKAIAAPR
jgi:hypothetical protein